MNQLKEDKKATKDRNTKTKKKSQQKHPKGNTILQLEKIAKTKRFVNVA